MSEIQIPVQLKLIVQLISLRFRKNDLIMCFNSILGECEQLDTKLCNTGGSSCDEGTDLSLSFSTASVAHAKCVLGANLLITSLL